MTQNLPMTIFSLWSLEKIVEKKEKSQNSKNVLAIVQGRLSKVRGYRPVNCKYINKEE